MERSVPNYQQPKGITMNENITYAKVTKDKARKVFRVETRELDYLDDWSTIVTECETKAAALAFVEAAGYELVPSWQAAFRREGMTVLPRTTLLYV
jgi:hypothetical protein